MGKKISISVVVPMYNREKTIERCLNSIINQSYKPYEIIVIDDGSDDNSANIVRGFKCVNIPIYLIECNHNGAQAARNIGIENAKGEYIAFLDSDDEWLLNKLEEQCKYIDNGFSEYVIYSNCFVIENNEVRFWKLYDCSETGYKGLLQCQGPMFQSMLVKKEKLKQIGLLDQLVVAYQEWDTAIRLAQICNFIFIEKPLFNYYIHNDTISKDTKKDVDGYEYIVEKYINDIIYFAGIDALYKHYEILYDKCKKYGNKKIEKYKKLKLDKNVMFFQQRRLLNYNELLLKWLEIRQREHILGKYFEYYGYSRIAIYGMKELGQCLFQELKNTDTNVMFGIDRNADNIVSDLPIIKCGEEIPVNIDLIVVTAINDYELILEDLNYYYDNIQVQSLNNIIEVVYLM